MVVFGGTSLRGVLNDTWALSLDDFTWSKIETQGLLTEPRFIHSAIYDTEQDRMIVFGGYTDTELSTNETWALSFDEPPTWTRLQPSGSEPLRRYFHSAIYDPLRHRMVVFGGLSDSDVADHLNDVWALSLDGNPEWKEMVPPAPLPPRFGHSAIYDEQNDRMVVFGGGDRADYRGDILALSLSNQYWSQYGSSGGPASQDETRPPSRYGHSAVYDPIRQRMVISGGEVDYTGPFRDTWSIDLSSPLGSWEPFGVIEDAPVPRQGHAAIYDPAGQQMVIFGGYGQVLRSDVWVLSLHGRPRWSMLEPLGTPPSIRESYPAAYDALRHRMIVCGDRSDNWALSLGDTTRWTQLETGFWGPSSARQSAAVYDTRRDRVLLFGGDDLFTDRPTNLTWALTLAGSPYWTLLEPEGDLPPGLVHHSAIYDAPRDRMIVCGGLGRDSSTIAVWALALFPIPTWTQLHPAGPAPPARWGHSAVYDSVRQRMIVYGGVSESPLDDAWSLSLSGDPVWTHLNPAGGHPGPRLLHSSIYDPLNDRAVVFGGAGPGGQLGELWFLDWRERPEIALTSTEVTLDAVGLTWQVLRAKTLQATLFRREENGEWASFATMSPDASGRLSYEDRGVSPGALYEYGLHSDVVDSTELVGEISVRVPTGIASVRPPNAPRFELARAYPNPAIRSLAVSFSLDGHDPATLDLVDLTGRRWLARHVGSLGPGRHTLMVDRLPTLPAGIYWVTLTQGPKFAALKVCIVR